MPRPRFRVRSLFLAIVLIAVVLGAVAHVREDRRLYRQLVVEQAVARENAMRAEALARQAEIALSRERDLRLQAEARAGTSASNR